MAAEERYGLASVDDGAILLDTVSGAFLELNESATFVWEQRLSGRSIESIVDLFAARYVLPRSSAAGAVATAMQLPHESGYAEPTNVRYERTLSGYSFAYNGKPILDVDQGGDRVKLITDLDDRLVSALPLLVRVLAPKLLSLRGEAVLHASAVEIGGSVIALSGLSGAGKTTTARALAQSTGHLISEDQLVVWTAGESVMVSREGESAIAAWVAAATLELQRAGEARCGNLSEKLRQQARLPLREIGFLDVTRRIKEPYRFRDLHPRETAGLTFRHSFYGSDERPHWVDRLKSAARIGRQVQGIELWLPNDLPRLEAVMGEVGEAATLRASGSYRTAP